MNKVEGPSHCTGDLHVHTWHSKDSATPPELAVLKAAMKGCFIAITDHNTINGAIEASRIVKKCEIGVKVIIGEEVTTGELNEAGKKIELLGYFLTKTIPRNGSIEQTLAEIKRQGGIIGIPHPFELWRHGAGNKSLEIIELAQKMGIPVCWEVFNSRSSWENNDKALDFFQEQNKNGVGLFAIAGSDAHHPEEIGRAHVIVAPFENKDDLLPSLYKNKYMGDDDSRNTLRYRILARMLTVKTRIASNILAPMA